jgi:hypothetical protein
MPLPAPVEGAAQLDAAVRSHDEQILDSRADSVEPVHAGLERDHHEVLERRRVARDHVRILERAQTDGMTGVMRELPARECGADPGGHVFEYLRPRDPGT